MNGHLEELENLKNIIQKHNLSPDALRRFFILYQPDEILAENLAARLRLTKKQKARAERSENNSNQTRKRKMAHASADWYQ